MKYANIGSYVVKNDLYQTGEMLSKMKHANIGSTVVKD